MFPSLEAPKKEALKAFYILEAIVHPNYEPEPADPTFDFALARLDYPIADNAYKIGARTEYRKH